MTKQEEIKEGLARILIDKGLQGITIGEQRDFLLRFLHSQGVVIKVEGEMPVYGLPREWIKLGVTEEMILSIYDFLLKAGCTLTKPLMKED